MSIIVRYLEFDGERWIAPLGTPDPEPIWKDRYDPRWVRARDRRLIVLTDGTAVVDALELAPNILRIGDQVRLEAEGEFDG